MDSSPDAPVFTRYTVVLRCPSSARFLPEQGQEMTVPAFPETNGPVVARLRTLWVDEGFETPTPRELWIEVTLQTPSLDKATSIATAVARFAASSLAFTANVQSGTPEVHVAFDSSPTATKREFLEVFLPAERGLLREGRMVKTDEYSLVLQGLLNSSESSRVSRALHHYELALRYWYIGGEYLALAHLYMAVEALTKAVLRRECQSRNLSEAELARANGIDPDDPERPRWHPALESWARRELIFRGDATTYDSARSASDGVEHGFMELNEVHERAMASTEQTFRYVRLAILELIGLSPDDHRELAERYPRDVASLRKIVRGYLLGEADELAAPDQEYPYVEWSSSIRSLTREGDTFTAQFNEKFTVRCAEGLSFQGSSFEARGRLEPGQEAAVPIDIHVEHVPADPHGEKKKMALESLTAASRLATALSANGLQAGMPPLKSIAFGMFGEEVSLFEAIHLLLTSERSVEAIVLLDRLLEMTCLSEIIAAEGEGAAIRLRLDALSRERDLFGGDEVERHFETQSQELLAAAATLGIDVPASSLNVKDSAFYMRNERDILFCREVAKTDDLAVKLHTETDENGAQFLRTTVVDPVLWLNTAGLALDALLTCIDSLARHIGWDYDEGEAGRLRGVVDDLSSTPDDARG